MDEFGTFKEWVNADKFRLNVTKTRNVILGSSQDLGTLPILTSSLLDSNWKDLMKSNI